jgi:hypothetical protein
MNTKPDTTIKATTVIHITIQDQKLTLSQADAYSLYYELAKALGIYHPFYSGINFPTSAGILNTPYAAPNNSGTTLPQNAIVTSEGTTINFATNTIVPQ